MKTKRTIILFMGLWVQGCGGGSSPADAAAPDSSTADVGAGDGSLDDSSAETCEMDFSGSYSVRLRDDAPSFCSFAELGDCTVRSNVGGYSVMCSSYTFECTIDADCVCSGMATDPLPATFTLDFPSRSAAVTIFDSTCEAIF